MLGSGLNLMTTVIGFGISATFIVFVCARLICGRAMRADADSESDAGAVAAARAMATGSAPFDFDIDFHTADLDRTTFQNCLGCERNVYKASAELLETSPSFEMEKTLLEMTKQIEHSHSGLEPFVVAAIPTMKYSCEAFHSKDDAQCSICLGEYNEKEILRIMPTCRHNFHLSCIDTWFQKQTTCPICRFSLKDVPCGKSAGSPARSLPQLFGHPESSVSRSPHWILPIHRDRAGGRGNSPISQESLDMVIEIQQEIR